MAKNTCPRVAFDEPACTSDDPCVTCGPSLEVGLHIDFRGGKELWHSGPTIAEGMRQNKEDWKGLKEAPEPVSGSRWV